ncbi:hypothetical protein [Vitiosangium sp. GDMCC 1.1324]|uniref:hypothetical protein n=1 Tax=Vitiosangium sp. (strain GDMCC 1.1324) TaxID=2138576 RepID=UPI000D393E71|nr:hypothetical protein [Vitiosangium sp. GDMCC 1.1324]PTL81876.1 hypothetical protein DAT35_22285 [Vitiosangium sp. GDMCC 1.1324]
MRIPSRVAVWLCIGVLCLGTRARAEEEQWTRALRTQLEKSCQEGSAGALCALEGLERRRLFEDIYEYSLRLQVGPGVHDVITLHRVVREASAGVPVRAPKSVFLVHGDVWGFRGAFLSSAESTEVLRQQSFAIFLARQGVDVWGIDLRWVHVPATVTDFSFMKDWNLGLHARDVGLGLALARSMRVLDGNAWGRMALLGWSRGAAVSYAYLNAETQLPPELRQVSGFIPVDMAYTLEEPLLRENACKGYAILDSQLKAKVYGIDIGARLQRIGTLALSRPEEPSPIRAGLTNRQLGLFVGSATYALQEPVIIPEYHFTGGQFSGFVPSGLSWTRERFFFEGLMQAAPYQSLGEQVDTLAMWCGAPDVPYDDHLSEVTVPVLYMGAAGGVGSFGLHSLTLLGSTDVSSRVVQLLPDASARPVDFGHVDLFEAGNAETLVWTPILDWLRHH